MSAKKFIIYEEKGEITLIKMNSLMNCLPVNAETFLRILYGLTMKGYVKLPVQETQVS